MCPAFVFVGGLLSSFHQEVVTLFKGKLSSLRICDL